MSAALDLIGVNALRADPTFAGIDGSGVSVAVIDTGVDFSHPLLNSAETAAKDFVYTSTTQTITDEHGTHVAGIIGARSNDIGVATGVGIIGLQVFNKSRSGNVQANDSDVERALQWVYENHETYNIVAVNMSLGLGGNYTSEAQAKSSILYDDVKRLESVGVTVVTAAGNSYTEYQKAGSASPGVFSTLDVGAVYETNEGSNVNSDGSDFTTAADRLAYFSQRPNTDNQIFAPGAFITSTIPGGGTKDLAGTSMAAPMVSGVVALMQEAALQFGGRELTPTEVRTIMRNTANVIVDGDDENTSVKTTGASYLRVNAYAAVKAIVAQFAGGNSSGEIDPNGTLAGAVAAPQLSETATEAVSGTIGVDGSTEVGGDDVDLYRAVVTAPGDLTVELPTRTSQTALRIFNAGGTEVASNVSAGGDALVATVAAGTYYVGVSGAPNTTYNPIQAGSGPDGATGDYTITFALSTIDADGVLTGATGINLNAGNVAQALNANVGMDGAKNIGGSDVDFYRVSVPDDGTLLVDIDTPNTTTFADTFVRIFDASGNQLLSSDDDLAEGISGQRVEFRSGGIGSITVVDSANAFQGHTTDSFIGGTVQRGDVYYIAVGNYNNRAFNPSSFSGRIDNGSTGAYSLFVSFSNNDVNGAIPQAVVTATLPLVKNPGVIGTDQGTVDVGDRDVDFIKLNSPTAGILEIDIDSYSDASITDKVDTVARLFDANGNLLALNDDSNTGDLDPLLRFNIDANADYYLAVSGKGNDRFDPFLLGSGGPGDTGSYVFSAQVIDASKSGNYINDTIASGAISNLAIDTAVLGNIGDDNGFTRGASDVDLHRFTATYTGKFIFTCEPSDDFGVDPYLRIFDASGNELAADDNGGGGTGGSRIVLALTAGQNYYIGVSGAGPSAGVYNPVTGAGAGDGDTGGYSLRATAGERVINFAGASKAIYTDAAGKEVTLSLTGPGSGAVYFDGEGAQQNASRIVLDGVTDHSSFVVKGAAHLDQVQVNGALKSMVAKDAELAGLTATASVRTLQVARLVSAVVTIGTGDSIALTADTVTDSSLTCPSGVRSIKIDSWSDTDGVADKIVAYSVSQLTVKGSFAADIDASTIGKVKIDGVLSGDVVSDGSITSLTAGMIGAVRILAGLPSNSSIPLPMFGSFPASAAAFAAPTASIGSIVVTSKAAGAFGAAVVVAPVINKASLGAVDTTNGGAVFGLSSDNVKSVSGVLETGKRFHYKKLDLVSESVTVNDFSIAVL